MKRLKYEAFFITPENSLIPVPLCLNHIDVICDHPELFGFTKDYVTEKFKKYNEPLRSEKRARNELMREAYKKGFIRLRYRKDHYWIAESENLFGNEKKRAQIAGWIKFMLEHKELNADEYMEVIELDTAFDETNPPDKESFHYFFSKVNEYPSVEIKYQEEKNDA